MLTMLVSNKESLEEREDLPEEVDLPLPTYDSAKDLDQRLAENQTLKKSLVGIFNSTTQLYCNLYDMFHRIYTAFHVIWSYDIFN